MSLPLSAIPTPQRPAPQRPAPLEPPRRLRAVEPTASAPARRPRLVYGIVAVVGAAAIAAAQMGLSIATTQGSYDLAQLSDKQQTLDWQTQELQEQLAGLDSPQHLAANAAALGMVIENAPAYLRLSDAAVSGAVAPATGDSHISPLSSASVPNALLDRAPRTTAPPAPVDPPVEQAAPPVDAQTLLPVVEQTSPEQTPVEQAPPPIADALPIPTTH